MRRIWNKKYLFWLALPFSMALVPLTVIVSNGWLYYVLIASIAFATSLYIWKKINGGQINSWLYVLNFFILYLMIVCGVLFYNWFLEFRLSQFDLDGDSLFSTEEQTPEQVRYMELLVNDVGRNLLLFTGILYSLAGTLLLFLLVSIFKFFSKRNLRNPPQRESNGPESNEPD